LIEFFPTQKMLRTYMVKIISTNILIKTRFTYTISSSKRRIYPPSTIFNVIHNII